MLEYLHDIESDLSVFHRVDDLYTLPARRFFRLAERLPAYDGVMRVRATALADDDNTGRATNTAAPRTAGRMQYDTPDTITPASVVSDPVLGSLISFGTGPS